MPGTELDIDQLRFEETLGVQADIDLAFARGLGLRALELAQAAGHPISIAVRLTGRTVFHVAMDGSAPIHDDWIMKKVRVVEKFHKSTLLVRAEAEEKGQDFHGTHGGTSLEWSPAGGAVCLRDPALTFRGVLAVSGLVQLTDHEFCREVLSDFE
jgi:uncharacterized protein (UPF0303 family)